MLWPPGLESEGYSHVRPGVPVCCGARSSRTYAEPSNGKKLAKASLHLWQHRQLVVAEFGTR